MAPFCCRFAHLPRLESDLPLFASLAIRVAQIRGLHTHTRTFSLALHLRMCVKKKGGGLRWTPTALSARVKVRSPDVDALQQGGEDWEDTFLNVAHRYSQPRQAATWPRPSSRAYHRRPALIPRRRGRCLGRRAAACLDSSRLSRNDRQGSARAPGPSSNL